MGASGVWDVVAVVRFGPIPVKTKHGSLVLSVTCVAVYDERRVRLPDEPRTYKHNLVARLEASRI